MDQTKFDLPIHEKRPSIKINTCILQIEMLSGSPQLSFSVKIDSSVICNLLIDYIKAQQLESIAQPSEWENSFSIVDSNSQSSLGDISLKLSTLASKSDCVTDDLSQTVTDDEIKFEPNEIESSAFDGNHLPKGLNNDLDRSDSSIQIDQVIESFLSINSFEAINMYKFEEERYLSERHEFLVDEGKFGEENSTLNVIPNHSQDDNFSDIKPTLISVKEINNSRRPLRKSEKKSRSYGGCKDLSKGRFKCDKCPYQSHSIAYVRGHIRNSHGDRYVHCTLCSQSSRQRCNLRRHYMRQHKLDEATAEEIVSKTKFSQKDEAKPTDKVVVNSSDSQSQSSIEKQLENGSTEYSVDASVNETIYLAQ